MYTTVVTTAIPDYKLLCYRELYTSELRSVCCSQHLEYTATHFNYSVPEMNKYTLYIIYIMLSDKCMRNIRNQELTTIVIARQALVLIKLNSLTNIYFWVYVRI